MPQREQCSGALKMPAGTEIVDEIRTDLAAVLRRLDEAGMPHPGAYVSMALDLLERETEVPPTSSEEKPV
jgi:hypothetical protein